MEDINIEFVQGDEIEIHYISGKIVFGTLIVQYMGSPEIWFLKSDPMKEIYRINVDSPNIIFIRKNE